MKQIFAIVAAICFAQTTHSQTQLNDNQLITQNYNLPHGSSPSIKLDKTIDYSPKRDMIQNANAIQINSQVFLYRMITPEKWAAIREINDPNEVYFNTAMEWFDHLSGKVKSVYSLEELWYIYQFDTVLATNLSTY